MNGHVVFLEKIFKATHDIYASGSSLGTIFPSYILPWKDDAPNVVIHKNSKYMWVNPTIPRGVHVTVDIIPNLKKL